MKKHMLTHESNSDLKYPFTCDLCQEKCTREQDLKNPILTHESNPDSKYTFNCDLCVTYVVP